LTDLHAHIEEAAAAIRRHVDLTPRIGMVIGTGLGAVVDKMDVAARIPYTEIPHFNRSTVESHAGELVLGHLAGKPVVALAGRFHLYEGYTMKQVTFPIRVFKALGIETVFIWNAAGGLNPQFEAGDIMVIADHINFMGDNPLIGPNDERLGPRFPDMSEPYSRALIKLAESIAVSQGIHLKKGVYLGCTGPCLETAAEYRFMRTIGADAVGMSTVPEVIVAVHAGLRVLAFSVITDECFPDALNPVDIAQIIATAKEAEPHLTRIVSSCIEQL